MPSFHIYCAFSANCAVKLLNERIGHLVYQQYNFFRLEGPYCEGLHLVSYGKTFHVCLMIAPIALCFIVSLC